MKQTYCTILFLLFFTLMAHAQDLTVKSFSASTDVDASVHRVNDLNGQACALVKVMVTDEVTDAKGASVVRQRDNKSVTKHGSNEYWVYLAKGARHLTVATQNHLPLKIDFKDYGITTLEGPTTYILQLNANKQAQQQRLTIKYSPSDAVVLIDSKVCQGQNGTYQTTLAPGNYKVIVSRSGYNPFSVTAEIMDSPVSLYAYLDKTTDEEAVTPQITVTTQNTTAPQNSVNQEDYDILGAYIREITDEKKKLLNINHGLEVIKVGKGALANVGISKDFIIQRVNNKVVKTIEDLQKFVNDVSTSKDPVLYIQGIFPSGKKGYTAVELTE